MERSTALVTGGSSGFGFELARAAAADGRDLLLVARDPGRLERAAAALRKGFRVQAQVFSQDLGERGAAESVAAEVQRRNLTIDVLVNNAGFAYNGYFRDQDTLELDGMLQTNVTALTVLTRLLLPGMLSRRSGRILNVASLAAFLPGPLMATYYATKAYVLSFTEAITAELAGSGVTATVACPGAMMTGFQARAQVDERALVLRGPLLSQASRVARIVYRDMMAGKRVSVPGIVTAINAFAAVHVPHAISLPVVRRMQEMPRTHDL